MSGSAENDGAVSIGFTGVGSRGTSLLERCLTMADVEIPAICDKQEANLDTATAAMVEAGREAPERYDDHEDLVARDDLDGVVVATSWEEHVQMAVTAMEHGVYPGVEVGPASTIEECWTLVDAYRDTGVPCMLLENACYGREKMTVMQMVRDGLFGELVHCTCGYLHDIRPRLVTGKETSLPVVDGIDYRTLHSLKRNGDVYPTHGIGPVAKYLGINRGNRFVSLTATASKSRGLSSWAEANLHEGHPARSYDWAIGDVITTTITCANGETIVVTHDCSLPRPKASQYRVQGTEGLWRGEDDSIYVDERSPPHEWESFDDYRDEYEHPLWKRYREAGIREGHGGNDFLTLRDYVTAVRRSAPPSIDVFDMAAWMAIAPLSEKSIALGGDAVEFPDFTGGDWMGREPTFGFDEPREGRLPISEILDESVDAGATVD